MTNYKENPKNAVLDNFLDEFEGVQNQGAFCGSNKGCDYVLVFSLYYESSPPPPPSQY